MEFFTKVEDICAKHYRLYKALKSQYELLFEEHYGAEVPKSFWRKLLDEASKS